MMISIILYLLGVIGYVIAPMLFDNKINVYCIQIICVGLIVCQYILNNTGKRKKITVFYIGKQSCCGKKVIVCDDAYYYMCPKCIADSFEIGKSYTVKINTSGDIIKLY